MHAGQPLLAIHHNCSGAKCPYSMMVSGTFALYASSRIVIPEGATSAAIDVMGTYTKVPRLAQGGFPVYQRMGPSVQYLFFWPAFQRWLIGPDYTTGSSIIQSAGGFTFGAEEVFSAPNAATASNVLSATSRVASCPDEASSWLLPWVISDGGGGWVSAFPIAVEEGAPRPSLWASCSRAG